MRAFGALAAAWLCAMPASAEALFDRAAKVVRQPLPKDPLNPQARTRVSCHYYPGFMVKEVDLGEKGAEQLSILPIAAGGKRPGCTRDNAPDERVIGGNDWTGYFRGVKGRHLFFDADDGWNGGIGFAVFAPDGRKLFEDAAKIWKSVAAAPAGVVLRYTRVYLAKCSLRADPAGCWQQVSRATGLSGAAPDCKAAYERERKRTPQFAEQILEVPSVIDYEVETVLAADAAKTRPVTGKALGCRPSD